MTVIVVTYNSRMCFARLQAALALQSAPYELIVFDNGSELTARPTSSDFPGAFIHQNEHNVGFAEANNLAVSRVDTAFVALLNPDAYPEPDWLSQLLAGASRYPQAAAFGSMQINALDQTLWDGAGDCYFAAGASWRGGHGHKRSRRQADAYTFSACAAAALYRTEAWRSAGGLDARYFAYDEDVDLCFRLRLKQWQVVQLAEARVLHVGAGGSQTKPNLVTFYTMRNRVWTFMKNMPPALLWPLLPAHIALTGYLLITATARGQGPAAVRGVAAALAQWQDIMRSRRTIRSERSAPALAIARAMTWSPLKMWRRARDLRPLPAQTLSRQQRRGGGRAAP